MEHPTQITSAYSVCVCEWVGHQSTWQPGSCLLNDVGFIYEVMADVWEGGKKVRWGEIETAWGCDIKISSRWWMSTRATLERTTKRLLCNGWQVISRFVGGGVPLCSAVRSVAFWNFPVHYWVVCSAPVYDLQGNESWCRSVTEEDCASCPVWKNAASFIEASLISDNCSLKPHLHESKDRVITWV